MSWSQSPNQEAYQSAATAISEAHQRVYIQEQVAQGTLDMSYRAAQADSKDTPIIEMVKVLTMGTQDLNNNADNADDEFA